MGSGAFGFFVRFLVSVGTESKLFLSLSLSLSAVEDSRFPTKRHNSESGAHRRELIGAEQNSPNI